MTDIRQPSTNDVRSAWKRAEAKLNAMTAEERAGTLVDAGILTADGKPTEPYKHLFLSRSTKAKGK